MDSHTIAVVWSIVFMLANLGDAWLTAQGIRLGARELNPVFAWIIVVSPRFVWAIKLAGAVLILWAIWTWSEGLFRACLIWALSLPFIYACFNNWRVLQRLKERSRP